MKEPFVLLRTSSAWRSIRCWLDVPAFKHTLSIYFTSASSIILRSMRRTDVELATHHVSERFCPSSQHPLSAWEYCALESAVSFGELKQQRAKCRKFRHIRLVLPQECHGAHLRFACAGGGMFFRSDPALAATLAQLRALSFLCQTMQSSAKTGQQVFGMTRPRIEPTLSALLTRAQPTVPLTFRF